MDDPEELLDLVNEHDEVIRVVKREYIPQLVDGTHGFVRASACFLVNSQGQVWLPRRLPTKKIAPNGLDFSAAEHVGTGESYVAAMVRGLHEELGIIITMSDISLVGIISPFSDMPYFHYIYRLPTDTSPNFNSKDFVSASWYEPAEIAEQLKTDSTAKAILLPALKLLIQTI